MYRLIFCLCTLTLILALESCAMLPPSLPKLHTSEMVKGKATHLKKIWKKQGITNPSFFLLKSDLKFAEPPLFTLRGKTFLVPRRTGWSQTSIIQFARHLPLRLGECSILADPILLVFFDWTVPAKEKNIYQLAARVLDSNQPLFIFIGSSGFDSHGRDSGGMTLHLGPGRSFSVVAKHNPQGFKYEPEQTIAHELGHMAGLAHNPAIDEQGNPNVNIMHPRGCLYCSFLPQQCRQLQDYFSQLISTML